MKAQVNLAVVISLVIGFIVLASSIAPLISTTLLGWPTDNPNANGLATLIIPAMFGMIVVVAFLWATGRRPPGYWGG